MNPQSETVIANQNTRNPLPAFLISMLTGIWAQYLFFEQPLGINVLALIITCLAGLLWLAWSNKIIPVKRNIWLAGCVFVFGALASLRAAQLTVWLNFLAAAGLSIYWAHLFRSGDMRRYKFIEYISSAATSTIEISLIKPITASVSTFQHLGRINKSARIWALVRGLLLAAPLLMILTMLLTSADIAFKQAVLETFRLFNLDKIPEIIGRVIYWMLAAWMIMGGLTYAIRPAESQLPPTLTASARNQPLGFIEGVVVLASVDLLFSLFVMIQFRYFFGGQGNISIAGYTYAEYARRGFAELIVVALFTLGLILLLHKLTRQNTTFQVWTFNLLADLLVILTGIILVSAFRRLGLYEQAYGFTQLRTYTHLFIIWLGVLLFILMLCIQLSRNDLFMFFVFAACLGFVFTLNLLNTDAFIARQNISRYIQFGTLDAVYLATLSDDAVPVLVPLLQEENPEIQQIIGGALHYRLNILDQNAKELNWSGWNFSSIRAYRVLNDIRSVLDPYPPQKYEWYFPLD